MYTSYFHLCLSLISLNQLSALTKQRPISIYAHSILANSDHFINQIQFNLQSYYLHVHFTSAKRSIREQASYVIKNEHTVILKYH